MIIAFLTLMLLPPPKTCYLDHAFEPILPDFEILTLLFYVSLSLWLWHVQDFTIRPRYLVTFTVGYDQKKNIDAAVKKVGPLSHSDCELFFSLLLLLNLYLQFSENFTIVLFHYDGRTSEWDEFEWSKQAIHVSVEKQTKWLAISSIII